ncbi:MAG: chitobiase/beta-hexosaminidase C-terminal domain-containing protein [Magnetococcus sp. YQC-5]
MNPSFFSWLIALFLLLPTLAEAVETTIIQGGFHSVALYPDGTVWTWGNNTNGNLGDGTTTARTSPIQVPGLTKVIAIAAGAAHTLALKDDKTVWAWGKNSNGQLGDGTLTDHATPTQVPGLTNVIAIAAGYFHSLALKSDNTVWAWGMNGVGQLGDTSTTDRSSPIQVSGLNNVIALSAGGGHNLALKADKTVWSWGDNRKYQLGEGTITNRTSAAQVMGVTDIISIATGADHSLAVKSDNTLWAWGDNQNGQLGNGTTIEYKNPIQTTKITNVIAIAAGWYHSMALKSDKTVWTWGRNNYGQLGDGNNTDRSNPTQIPGMTNVTAIAAMAYNTMALKSDNTIWAWGSNGAGQLSDGTTTDRSSPIQIAGLPKGATTSTSPPKTGDALMIKAGGNHSVALFPDGTVWAWGRNGYGQLGDGTTTDRSNPIQIPGLTNIIAIATGTNHTLALKSDKTVWAWGNNDFGQLGNGITININTYTFSSSPVQVVGLTDVTAIAAGNIHSMAVKADKTVWAWGRNSNNQLGDGTTTDRSSPVQVTGMTNAMAVAAGATHSLVLKTDNTLWAWGFNGNNELGDGTTTKRTSPVQVSGMTNVIAMTSRSSYNLALKADKTVWAWGWNGFGNLGDGTTTKRSTPIQVPGMTNVTAIAAGEAHSLAVKSDNTLWAWGSNSNGQLGDKTTTDHSSPVQVSGATNVTAIAAGNYHSLALKSDNTILAWGYNNDGQVGDGTTLGRKSPIPVPGLNNIKAIAAGTKHSVTLKSDNTVWTWGGNFNGQLGDGTTTHRSNPLQVSGLTDVADISSRGFHTLVLKSNSTVWAWGYNNYGQLGNGTTTSSSSPVQVSGLTNITAISAGSYHNLALKSDKTVWAWGRNDYGQLGDTTTTARSSPVQVLTNVIAIAAGFDFSLALKSDNTVWAWGRNSIGNLGDSSMTNRSTPVQISEFTNVIAISAGGLHVLALKSDNTLWTWGMNNYGALGDGTSTTQFKPILVPGMTNITAIAAGVYHSLVLKSDQTVWAWGNNADGQLGDGSATHRFKPVQIAGLTNIKAIAAGNNHSMALKSDDNTVLIWGNNENYQLGFDSNIVSPQPVKLSLNTSPTLADIANQQGNEDNSIGPIALTIGDTETPAENLTVTATSSNAALIPADNAHLILGGNGANRTLTLIPASNQNGSSVITVTVSDGTTSVSKPFTVTVAPVNDLPTISGTASTKATPGVAYSFAPVASDADGDTLTFSITNKPAWLNFNTTNGILSGTPTPKDYGTYRDIVISVTSGTDTVALPALTISMADITHPITGDIPEGIFKTAQNITLTCQDEASGCAGIYYTLDGSTPTTSSTRYTAPVVLSANTVLKYIAVDQAGLLSEVRTKNFTIDQTPPQVAITEPVDGASLNGLSWITGTASDNAGTGIASIKLQLTDGSGYLNALPDGSVVLSPPFLYAQDQLPWVAVTDTSKNKDFSSWIFYPPNIWKIGSTYSLTVRATDRAGNVTDKAILFAYSLDGGKAFTQMKQELSSQAVLQGKTLDVTGQLTRLPVTAMSLAGREITMKVMDPNGVTVTTATTTTTDQDGHFLFRDVGGFNQKGRYTIETAFVGTPLLDATKISSTLLVGQSAGYAVIVEGKISNEEGLAAHNKTANRIYQHLLARGFEKDKIFYFNHDPTQPGVDARPTKTEVEQVISGAHPTFQLASLMNGAPAPVYIILVDHGSTGKFYLNGDAETIASTELNAWLTSLESRLVAANNEKRIVVLGACFSGSFVSELSAPNRVVISSASANEESYKGPKEDDGVRAGEFFLEVLFKQLGRGNTFAKAFQESVTQTGVYTRSGGGSANSTKPPFFDHAMQHPLLDDNGDKKGSNQLTTDTSGDGAVARGMFLGTGVSYTTNSLQNPAEVTAVTETLYLAATMDSATLWAKANDDSQVQSAWIEIRPPSMTLVAGGSKEQLEINLDRFLLNPPVNGRWAIDLAGKYKFQDPGLYEIYYFMRDKVSGDISPMMRSLVYKQKAVNAGPDAFSLLAPANEAKAKTVALFNWNPSMDADGLTYNLIIAKDNAFKDVVYRKEEIWNTTTFVDETAQLNDLTTYYWKIQAVDAYGSITDSKETWSFKTDNTNGIPGIVFGILLKSDSSPAAHATVKVNDTVVQTSSDGSFILLTNPGTVSVSGGQSATQQSNMSFLDIKGGKSIRINITMQAETSTTSSVPGTTTSVTTTTSIPVTTTSVTTTTTVLQAGQTSPILDVDQSGSVDATDGVLLLRKLNGASTIDTGVILPFGQNNSTVLNTIHAIGSKLDVDQSGTVDATDGVLILRKLNGASTIDTGVVLPFGQNNGTVVKAIDAISK